MKAPAAFLYDIGNVLFHFDFSIAGKRIRKQSADPKINHLALVEDIKTQLEAGNIDGSEFVEEAVERTQFQGSEEEFTKLWQEIFTPNEAMIEFVEGLAGRYPLYILSNTSDIHVDYFLETYPVFELFDGSVYSYAAQSAKPERKIFEEAISTYGLVPEETLYIDDLSANITTGKKLGFRSHRYDASAHDDFLKFVAKHGVTS